MANTEHLNEVLADQSLTEDSEQIKALRAERAKVEDLLRAAYPKAELTIRYGGSYKKGTMVRESYDLDIVSYFGHEETAAGDSLPDIYASVRKALSAKYLVQEKTSALRLTSLEPKQYGTDFRIDVVPGRFVDATKGDCFLHQNLVDKDRLKTNLDVHIAHVKDSGVLDALRLLKLWRIRQNLTIKQFVFELLCIDLLAKKKKAALDDQLAHVWTELANASEPMTVEDPANPTGNDLTSLVKERWTDLAAAAKTASERASRNEWDTLFPLDSADTNKVARLSALASSVTRPTKPWAF